MAKELRERRSKPSHVTGLPGTNNKDNMNVSPSAIDYESQRQNVKERSNRILESRGTLYSDASEYSDEGKESDSSSYEPPIDPKTVNASSDLMDFFETIGPIEIDRKMDSFHHSNRKDCVKTIMGTMNASSVSSNENPFDIDEWIETVRNERPIKSFNRSSCNFEYKTEMPTMDEVLAPFPDEMIKSIQKKREDGGDFETSLDPSLDVSLMEYIQIICSILDIPIRDGYGIESLHCLFQAYCVVQSKEDEVHDMHHDEWGAL